MAFFRHLLPVLTGAALGCAATLLAQRFAQQGEPEHIVGPEAFDDAAEPEADAPETPVEAPAPQPEVVYPAADDSAPNPNPVKDHTDPVPVVDGKMDPEKIAKPEDFADWDDLGCQGYHFCLCAVRRRARWYACFFAPPVARPTYCIRVIFCE